MGLQLHDLLNYFLFGCVGRSHSNARSKDLSEIKLVLVGFSPIEFPHEHVFKVKTDFLVVSN
uniref:Uncharacterized protein n=1 Tax=Nelumbo nucifera TaxID=4432 RepID=A0A822XJP7_NELNU|nr:TPA_asm: hypothetical protein HUJ06_020752 [Nelumbo nucifera]